MRLWELVFLIYSVAMVLMTGVVVVVVESAVCSPEFDYDLSGVQLPFTFSKWQPSHPFGTETLLCPSIFEGPKNASLDKSKSTVFKWIAPADGNYQIKSFSPKIQIRFVICTEFQNLSYSEQCRQFPRQGQFFVAENQGEYRILVEGDHASKEAVVTIDRYEYDERFCLVSSSISFPIGQKNPALPICVSAESMSASIAVGVFVGLILVFVARPGPLTVLFCLIVICGLLPGLFFLWTFAASSGTSSLIISSSMYIKATTSSTFIPSLEAKYSRICARFSLS